MCAHTHTRAHTHTYTHAGTHIIHKYAHTYTQTHTYAGKDGGANFDESASNTLEQSKLAWQKVKVFNLKCAAIDY